MLDELAVRQNGTLDAIDAQQAFHYDFIDVLENTNQASVTKMITPEEENAILAGAYVPEHSVELMTGISGGEPFLFQDYFCCRTQDRIIVVGYPLEKDFERGSFEKDLESIIRVFRPTKVSLIAPEAPVAFEATFVERSTDMYYTLDLELRVVRGTLRRILRKAGEAGIVERAAQLTDAHRRLAQEFVERVDPPLRIRELLFRMWEYMGRSKKGVVLNALDHRGQLAAFFVVDLAPKDFATYVIGCHSKTNYLPGASDLLMSEMIKISSDSGKRFIHLGIGINTGIRKFKEKWGGLPTRPYELCELALQKPSLLTAIFSGISRS